MAEEQRRRRAHEGIPGEATLSQLLPKGWTLLLVIGAGVAYGAFTYADIRATAGNVKMVQQTQVQHAERLRILEQAEAVASDQRRAIREEQRQQADDAKADRAEIIGAIRQLRRP